MVPAGKKMKEYDWLITAQRGEMMGEAVRRMELADGKEKVYEENRYIGSERYIAGNE